MAEEFRMGFSIPGQDAQKLLESFSTDNELTKEAPLQMSSGLTLDKYFMHVTTLPQNTFQVQEGIYYEYIVKNGKGIVWAFYHTGLDSTDDHAFFEEAVKTIALK